ncbi:unnamed protein product [Merluccius merluccius]
MPVSALMNRVLSAANILGLQPPTPDPAPPGGVWEGVSHTFPPSPPPIPVAEDYTRMLTSNWVNWKKSNVQPHQQAEFLGILFDSASMKASLTGRRADSLIETLRPSVLGGTGSSCSVVSPWEVFLTGRRFCRESRRANTQSCWLPHVGQRDPGFQICSSYCRVSHGSCQAGQTYWHKQAGRKSRSVRYFCTSGSAAPVCDL